MKTIKELRSNFIRRNHVSPDFFSLPTSHDPEESSHDTHLLHFKQLPSPARSNNFYQKYFNEQLLSRDKRWS